MQANIPKPVLGRGLVRGLPQDIPYGSIEGAPLLLGLSYGEITPVSLPLAETTSLCYHA